MLEAGAACHPAGEVAGHSRRPNLEVQGEIGGYGRPGVVGLGLEPTSDAKAELFVPVTADVPPSAAQVPVGGVSAVKTEHQLKTRERRERGERDTRGDDQFYESLLECSGVHSMPRRFIACPIAGYHDIGQTLGACLERSWL